MASRTDAIPPQVAVEERYHGSMATRTLRQDAPPLVRLAPRPGERAYICSGLIFRTEGSTLVLSTITLAYSRALWAEFCQEETPDATLAPVLEHAWEFFGGAPRTWLFETVRPTAPLEASVLTLAHRCGAVPRAFAPADGVRWGEWALRRVPHRLLRRHLLRDLGLANRLLRAFVDEQLWRDHPHQPDRRVYEMLDDERGHLRPAGTP